MINSLYIKLVLALFALCLLIGAVFLAVVMYTAPMYQQEVSQQLNRDLAMYIVDEHVLLENGKVRQDNLEKLFHKAMIINPSLELYLLDESGNVMAHSMPEDRLKRKQVSLEPVQAFLEHVLPDQSQQGDYRSLILGDDPAKLSQQNSFTAAPIDIDGKRQGYIYAILGSEKIENITDVLQESLIVKWSAGVVIAALVLAFLVGLGLFSFLMRKLNRLSRSMQTFSQDDPEVDVNVSSSAQAGDEIDAMALTFEHMAQRLHSQMLRLQETDSLRRELVANVSHDLRTPLSSLGGYLETLLLKSSDLTEQEKQQYLRIAHENANRLSGLVEELFELAKLDANEVRPQQEPFSLAELVYDVSAKFDLRAREKDISFDVRIDESVSDVSADVAMIERVLTNLIDNALKHTPSGGAIGIHLNSDDDGKVSVSLSDTGYGIAKDELPHIFKRFYRRASSDEDSSRPGLGLGLAIASRIVELHGSMLSVDSVLHQGTTFRFSLQQTSV
jgi:signal transduction histidine kinase